MIADRLMEKNLHFNRIHEPKNPEGAGKPYADATRGIYLQDDLVVLRQTRMMAVLLEGGVIVNREEEVLVATPAYQSSFATAVAKAIAAFCRPAPALASAPAAATFKVIGVATSDVLNIRSGPEADAGVVIAIPPNGRGIRMVGDCAGQWCQIQYLNAKGWVNRRFLAGE